MQALVTFSHVSWSPYTINDDCWFHGLLIQGTAHLGPLMYALSVAIVGTCCVLPKSPGHLRIDGSLRAL